MKKNICTEKTEGADTMTDRDHFAMAALTGLCAHATTFLRGGSPMMTAALYEGLVRRAYRIADGMLLVRAEPAPPPVRPRRKARA